MIRIIINGDQVLVDDSWFILIAYLHFFLWLMVLGLVLRLMVLHEEGHGLGRLGILLCRA